MAVSQRLKVPLCLSAYGNDSLSFQSCSLVTEIQGALSATHGFNIILSKFGSLKPSRIKLIASMVLQVEELLGTEKAPILTVEVTACGSEERSVRRNRRDDMMAGLQNRYKRGQCAHVLLRTPSTHITAHRQNPAAVSRSDVPVRDRDDFAHWREGASKLVNGLLSTSCVPSVGKQRSQLSCWLSERSRHCRSRQLRS